MTSGRRRCMAVNARGAGAGYPAPAPHFTAFFIQVNYINPIAFGSHSDSPGQ